MTYWYIWIMISSPVEADKYGYAFVISEYKFLHLANTEAKIESEDYIKEGSKVLIANYKQITKEEYDFQMKS